MVNGFKSWTLIGAAMGSGLIAGFSVPLAASYQPAHSFRPRRQVGAKMEVLVISPTLPVIERDVEMEKLTARNRRLEVLLATLRKRPK